MIQIIAQFMHLENCPMLFGMFGAIFGLLSIISLLIGSAFTDHVSLSFCPSLSFISDFFLPQTIGHLGVSQFPFFTSSVSITHLPVVCLVLVLLCQSPHWWHFSHQHHFLTQSVSAPWSQSYQAFAM